MRLLLFALVVSVVTPPLVTAGESKIVGLSEVELISCAGFPAAQMQLNGYKFSSTSEGGAAFPAGGIVLFGLHSNASTHFCSLVLVSIGAIARPLPPNLR